jgi:hypothetical protein
LTNKGLNTLQTNGVFGSSGSILVGTQGRGTVDLVSSSQYGIGDHGAPFKFGNNTLFGMSGARYVSVTESGYFWLNETNEGPFLNQGYGISESNVVFWVTDEPHIRRTTLQANNKAEIRVIETGLTYPASMIKGCSDDPSNLLVANDLGEVSNITNALTTPNSKHISADSSLPHGPIASVAGAENAQKVVLLYEAGECWVTSDNGMQWSEVSSSLPFVSIHDAFLAPNGEELLLATDMGLWYIKDIDDEDEKWHRVPDLPAVPIIHFNYDRASGEIYVATRGRGVFRSRYFGPGT